MNSASQVIDFQKYIVDKDVDSRIKPSRDDMLRIMQADIKALDAKVDKNFEVLNSKIEVLDAKIDGLAASTRADIKALDAKVDSNFEILNSKIEVLDAKIDGLASSTRADIKVLDTKIERLDDRITQVISMRKWAVGMFVVILLAVVAPYIAALF